MSEIRRYIWGGDDVRIVMPKKEEDMRSTVELHSPDEEAHCPGCGQALGVSSALLGLNRSEKRYCPRCGAEVAVIRRWAIGPTEHKS